MKQRHKFWNNLLGWSVFAISAMIYVLTLEPTVSYWDCGEFIATAYKLEVGHPPGAPLFFMIAKVFSLFAIDKTYIAYSMNMVSAFASAFTVMFLFWTFTRLAFKISDKSKTIKIPTGAVFIAGLICSLSFAFTDTFWFSAVETEVYAMSILFTAVVFWAMLRWDEVANHSYANKWLLLIAYLIGLSIGVHLLNLLVIPAITVVFYFRIFKPSVKGFLVALFVGFLLLFVIQNGIIIGIVQLAGVFELYCINQLHFPFQTGIILYVFLLIFLLFIGIWISYKYKYFILNTCLFAFTFLLIGYSSYTLIAIRANTNTPINEGNPSSIFSFINYLSREQYGDRPLFYGQNYNAPIIETVQGDPVYVKQNNRYVVSFYRDKYVYDNRFCTFFPRMYSSNANHIDVYQSWGNVKGKTVKKNNVDETIPETTPTFIENVQFFLNYQVYYMYIRYFLWNFSGKQNDVDSNGGILKGNFITGISPIDNLLFGMNDHLPNFYKNNKGRNTYFLLPLLLGFIGIFFLIKRNVQTFTILTLLFVMTGLAIVVYLNQTPLQPRERDYAYVGSFYAFTLWIGFGVIALYGWLKKWGVIIACSVPAILFAQNLDDHNRSNRYTTRSLAMNYLNSCAPNAILFTNGDNDTFPLWYLQEVEGIRTDVRVVNTMLLNSEWYIDQMKQHVYLSDTLPISLQKDEYAEGKRSFIYFVKRRHDAMTLKEAVLFARSNQSDNKVEIASGELLDIIPTKQLLLPVNKNKVLEECLAVSSDSIPQNILITINRSHISKSSFVVMDILANNDWKRPIYFTSPNGDETFGLSEYLRLEGFAYRLTPIKSEQKSRFDLGRVDSKILYHNLMQKFEWGNMNHSNVYIDDINIRMASIMRIRVNFARLAKQLYTEGKKDSAQQVIQKCIDLMPCKLYPHDTYSIELMETAKQIGATKQFRQLVLEYSAQCNQMIRYVNSLPKNQSNLLLYEKIVAERAQKTILNIYMK